MIASSYYPDSVIEQIWEDGCVSTFSEIVTLWEVIRRRSSELGCATFFFDQIFVEDCQVNSNNFKTTISYRKFSIKGSSYRSLCYKSWSDLQFFQSDVVISSLPKSNKHFQVSKWLLYMWDSGGSRGGQLRPWPPIEIGNGVWPPPGQKEQW